MPFPTKTEIAEEKLLRVVSAVESYLPEKAPNSEQERQLLDNLKAARDEYINHLSTPWTMKQKLRPGYFYQIRKMGQRVDQISYPTFEQTCYEWEHDPAGREVVLADNDGKIAHIFTAKECREAALRFRNLNVV